MNKIKKKAKIKKIKKLTKSHLTEIKIINVNKKINQIINIKKLIKIMNNKTTSIFNLLNDNSSINNNIDNIGNISELRNTSMYDDDLFRSSSIDYFGPINDNNKLNTLLSNNTSLKLTSKNIFNSQDFEILSSLGSGAYAEVYKAKHKNSGEIYAIKIIDKKKIDRENKTYQIFVENEMLNLCNNKNIISIYGYYEDIDKFYLVEEYCKIGDLSKYIENNDDLSINEIKFITSQIVLALEYLGSLRIIHRDVKPENIMIDGNFNIKLIDFGTSTFKGKILNEENYQFIDENRFINDPTFTESYNYLFVNNKMNNNNNLSELDKKNNLENKKSFFLVNKLKFESHTDQNTIEILKKQKFVGTVEYMPPEIINFNSNKNNNIKIAEYSDIWSLGITLFQLLTGKTPFNDKTDYLIFQNISQGKINQSLLKDIDNDAKDLILNILKVNPKERLGYDEIKGYDYKILKNHPFFIVDSTIDINLIRKSLLLKSNSQKINFYKNSNNDKPIFEVLKTNMDIRSVKTNKSKMTEEETTTSNNTLYNGNFCGKILKKGLLKKRSPYYYYDLRKVVLYDTPRIDYLEPNTKILKGTILLDKSCNAELVKSNQFLLKTPKRVYSFMCKEKFDISPWVSIINNAIEQFSE